MSRPTEIDIPLTTSHRTEIDGLRSFAIIPVLLFHGGFEIFNRGYLGVDIFFVISGYLITLTIIKDVSNNKFSLIKFYTRRMRRIFPNLFFVCLVSFPVLFYLLPETQLDAYLDSLVATVFFAANFFFMFDTDYFSLAAEYSPMVHMWSLGVEEQFYLLYPLVFLFSILTKRLMLVFLALLIASFSLSLLIRNEFPLFDFYSSFTRGWQFMVGAAASLITLQTSAPWAKHYLFTRSIVWLAFVLLPLTTLNLGFFPELISTIIVTISTAVVLVFAQFIPLLVRLLSLKFFVVIGKISFSLYLWHQPIFVVSRTLGFETDDPISFTVLICIATLMSGLSFIFIEENFRYRLSSKIAFSFIICSSLTLLSLVLLIKVNDHHPFIEPQVDKSLLFSYELHEYEGRLAAVPFYKEECNYYYRYNIESSCMKSEKSGQTSTTLIWGDSHAQALAVGLREVYGDTTFFAQLATSSCKPAIVDKELTELSVYAVNAREFVKACERANAFANSFIANENVESVLITLKSGYSHVDWFRIIDFLESQGVKRLIVVGPVPKWRPSLPDLIFGVTAVRAKINADAGLDGRVFSEVKYIRSQKISSSKMEVEIVYPTDFLCKSNNSCLITVPGAIETDAPLVFDYGHLSLSGSIYLAKSLFENGW